MKGMIFKIGEFAKLFGVSAKTLRLYDEKGILSPCYRDGRTNYRYYTEDQIFDASIILQLKALGFSLMDIKKVVSEGSIETVESIMALKINKLQEEIDIMKAQFLEVELAHKSLIASLAMLSEKESTSVNDGDLVIQIHPATLGVYTRYVSSVNISELHWDRTIELQQIILKENLHVSGPMTAILHDHYTNQFLFEDGDLEVFFPVLDSSKKSENIKEYESFLGASITHLGDYGTILQTYVHLVKAINSKGYNIIGPAQETYQIGMNLERNPYRFVTTITFPVEKAVQE